MTLSFSLIYLVLISQQSGFIFIENKGQWNNEVKFKTDLKNGHLYTCADGLVFDFFDEEKLEELYEKHYIKPTNSRNNKLKKHAYKFLLMELILIGLLRETNLL